jgi:hypothetical protein
MNFLKKIFSSKQTSKKETRSSQIQKPEINETSIHPSGRSVEDEYKIANANLKLFGMSPIKPPATGTDKDRLLLILKTYQNAMYTSHDSSDDGLSQVVKGLSEVTRHTQEIIKRKELLTT